MSFTAIHSNRVEELFSSLATTLRSPAEGMDCLAPEYILVDNKVLGEWVNLQLAQQQGIAANIRYVQPHELFWLLARAIVSAEIPRATPLSKEEMTWKLYGLFDNQVLLASADMQQVNNYLAGKESRDLKRYQLALSVADLFDQYLIYRPDWINAWSSNKAVAHKPSGTTENDMWRTSERWQRVLWQQLCAQSTQASELRHRAAIEHQLLRTLDHSAAAVLSDKIPLQRLQVFGMTSMPPYLVDMLMLLGKHIPVHLYALNPCREIWCDITSEKALARKAGKCKLDSVAGDIGNPLLASQGTQVKEFVASLYSRMDQFEFEESEAYVDPGAQTLLQAIQQEILDLNYQGGIASLREHQDTSSKNIVPPNELLSGAIHSVHIHNCHSQMREVEVLHDQLLAMFTQDKTLKPRDVVVMMPEVSSYVPYIETVFGNTADHLPYHITDRTWQEEVPLLNTLELLLKLPDSRLPLTEILAMLEVPAVQQKFGLKRNDYEILKEWLVASGARWGLDAAHREGEGLPAYSEFSWEFALNRLFAGYSMGAANDVLCTHPLQLHGAALSVLPYDEVEGSNSQLLDSFLLFWQRIMFYRTALRTTMDANNWAILLSSMLDDFCVTLTEEEQLGLREIRRALEALRQAQQWYQGEIALPVIRALMKPVMQKSASGRHQWREGIKFCSLLPMRGVPFKVVYMLGMNQADYPKRVVKQSFDLMRNDHRPGDRSRHVDDRWLFLEALLSARNHFHISYIGRDQRKNERREPSVVVAELMDYVRHGYCVTADDHANNTAVLNMLTTEHALQPFSQRYFDAEPNTGLLSFNASAFAIASTSGLAAPIDTTWQPSSVLDKSATPLTVSIDSFVRFFTDAPKWFFKNQHNISLTVEDESVSDTEVFALAHGLEMWVVKDAMREMALVLQGGTEERVASVLSAVEQQWQAQGRWPLGAAGESVKNNLLKNVSARWLDAGQAWGAGAAQKDLNGVYHCTTSLGELVIEGSVRCINHILFLHTASKKSPKYELEFYIRSAFAGQVFNQVQQARAVFFKENDLDQLEVALHAKSHAALLGVLAEYYMCYREHGLPFDPALSHAINRAVDNPAKQQLAVKKAWESDGNFSTGIADEMQSKAYFVNIDRLYDPAFIAAANEIWSAVDAWQHSGTQP